MAEFDQVRSTPRSLLTEMNEEFRKITGYDFFIHRKYDSMKREWTYVFADGVYFKTYTGACTAMRSRLRRINEANGKRRT